MPARHGSRGAQAGRRACRRTHGRDPARLRWRGSCGGTGRVCPPCPGPAAAAEAAAAEGRGARRGWQCGGDVREQEPNELGEAARLRTTRREVPLSLHSPAPACLGHDELQEVVEGQHRGDGSPGLRERCAWEVLREGRDGEGVAATNGASLLSHSNAPQSPAHQRRAFGWAWDRETAQGTACVINESRREPEVVSAPYSRVMPGLNAAMMAEAGV